jgi:hypothetical protein
LDNNKTTDSDLLMLGSMDSIGPYMVVEDRLIRKGIEYKNNLT